MLTGSRYNIKTATATEFRLQLGDCINVTLCRYFRPKVIATLQHFWHKVIYLF